MAQKPQDAASPATPQIDGVQVANYLRENPDFLVKHPDLLLAMRLPPRHRGSNVLDMQGFLMERQRAEIDRLQADYSTLVAAARHNLASQSRAHASVLALLDASTFEHLIETITTDLAVLLDVDAVSLCIETSEAPLTTRGNVAGVQLLQPGMVDHILGPGRDVLLRSGVSGDPAIFGGGAGLVWSDALVRLRVSRLTPSGLFALGSRDKGKFQSGQGTELLEFLARVLEHCIRRWLDLPGWQKI